MTPPPRVVSMRAVLEAVWTAADDLVRAFDGLDDEHLLTREAHDRCLTVLFRQLTHELDFARAARASRKQGAR